MFTPEQFQKGDAKPSQGDCLLAGRLEVKGPAEDVQKVARSQQVKRYSAKYGLVLVTNFREFLLIWARTPGQTRADGRVHAGGR